MTKDEIKSFYTEYKENISQAKYATEIVLSAHNKEEWLENIHKRKNIVEKLYKRNEELLSKYIYPFINGEATMTKELADIYYECVADFSLYYGFIDHVACFDITECIKAVYIKENDRNGIIKANRMIGSFCSKEPSFENMQIADKIYSEQIKYVDNYFEIEDAEVRRYVLNAYANKCIMYLNSVIYMYQEDDETVLKFQEELMECVKNAKAFYSDKRLVSIEDNEKLLKKNCYYIDIVVCGNVIGEMNANAPVNEELLEYTYNCHKKKYDEIISENPDIYEVDEGIFCNYCMCRFKKGEISRLSFVQTVFDYCKHCIENDVPKDEDIIDPKYFNVCTTRLPYLLQYVCNDEISEEYANEVISYSVKAFLDVLKHFPVFGTRVRVSTEIEDAALLLVPYLPKNISPFYFLLKTIINRDESSMLHAAMVNVLSQTILEKVFEKNPRLLVGILDTESVAEVFEKKHMILDYVRLASMIFDIGKISYSSVLSISNRKLTQKERMTLENHPTDGYSLVKNLSDLQPFLDIIIGHHKDYDGKGGYPKDYDNTKSKNRFVVDLIRICDWLDNVTNFTKQSTEGYVKFESILEDMEKGSGTLYNPDIVELIIESNELKHKLGDICILNRDNLYYETYSDLLDKDNKNRYEKIETENGLPIWAKGTIRIIEIDFFGDTIKTLYQSSDNKMPTEINGKFENFWKEHFRPFLYDQDWKMLQSLLDYGSLADKLISHDGVYETEARIRYNEGWRWVRLQFVVEEQHYGIISKLVLSIHDIDEQYRQRQEMLEALERANEEARLASRAKSLFISNISHEIRTPMNAIVGMVEILLRDVKDEREIEYLKNIQTSGQALLTLINDILDFSKMEAGKLEVNDMEYDVLSVMNDLNMIFLNRIGEKPIEYLVDIDKNMPTMLYGDSKRIRQVVINIVNNAIKFTDIGYVKLKVYVQEIVGDEITLAFSVRDTGIGIKKEDIPRLFGAFFQADTKRNYEKEGTGLGLIISKQLVELMGGSIGVESVYGEGTEFSFTVKQKLIENVEPMKLKSGKINDRPVRIGAIFSNRYQMDNIIKLCRKYEIEYINVNTDEALPDYIFTDSANSVTAHRIADKCMGKVVILHNPMSEIVNDEEAIVMNKPMYSFKFCQLLNDERVDSKSYSGESCLDFIAPEAEILIADDTEMNLTVAKGLLNPINMKIDTAENGKIAVEKVKSKKYDLIFMDHKMPVMDGVEATQSIRSLEGEYFKTLPIIALTANAVNEARKIFEEAGMNDFVAKPIEMKEICGKLKKWLPSEKIINKKIIVGNLQDNSIPEAIEGINLQEGLKNTGNAKMLGELLCDYYRLIDVKSSKIRECLENGDIKGYTVEVHAMKSVSRMIGALELSEKFKQLEEWGDKHVEDRLIENTPKVLEQYEAYKGYLREYVQSCENKCQTLISNEEMIEILENICVSMENCDMDMIDMCMERINKCKVTDKCKEQVDKLKLAVADFAMEDTISIAKGMIKTLKEKEERI